MSSNKSIISSSKLCYICGKWATETHHCIYGTGKRKLADEDGLTVRLCRDCHTAIHNSNKDFDRWLDKALKQTAQGKWEERYGSREDFIRRYGRSYLD